MLHKKHKGLVMILEEKQKNEDRVPHISSTSKLAVKKGTPRREDNVFLPQGKAMVGRGEVCGLWRGEERKERIERLCDINWPQKNKIKVNYIIIIINSLWDSPFKAFFNLSFW